MKEIRTIDNMKVRQMYIKDNYYTCGTNEEYSNLLFNLCEKDNVTLNDLEEIANDILLHSAWERKAKEYGYGYNDLLASVMTNLINECCMTFIEL